QRRADRLARDIADRDTEVRGVVPDEVVEVAADLIRGLVVDREVEADDMTLVCMAVDQRRARRKSTTLPGVTSQD
ncbi:MAG TPA: hypothetical protein VMJ10_15610, partial [Kofleriaceae bacterium]|nr:hypothetical protein [Kofleriaceae bacterium]